MMNCIAPTAVVGKDCEIGNFVTIGENCVLGDGVILHNNVTLYPGTKIGDYTEIFDGTVIGRPPKSNGNMVHKIPKTFDPTVIGENCVIGSNVVIYAQTKLGNNVLLGDGVALRENGDLGDFCLIAMNCTINRNVKIGARSKMMDLSHITANAVIGEDVFIGVGVSSANDNAMRMKGQEVGRANDIHLKNNCRIASQVMLLPGVTVGENAFVGASSLVTKDVPDNTMVLGIPARPRERKD